MIKRSNQPRPTPSHVTWYLVLKHQISDKNAKTMKCV